MDQGVPIKSACRSFPPLPIFLMTQSKTIIIDCDPGIDDAVALLLAFASPEDLTIKAVTTVAGNVPLHRTEANARRIQILQGAVTCRFMPVARGH